MSAWDRLRHGRRLNQILDALAAVHLLRAGLRLGLFQALRAPQQADALAERLGLAHDLVGAWLEAAAAEGLLVRDAGAYRIGGFVTWLLDAPEAGTLQAFVDEVALGWGRRFEGLADVMKGGERPSFGSREEALRLAAAIRILEGPALRALANVPGARQARRVLDIGCGQGTYLAGLLLRHRDAHGLGIELDPHVAEQARQRLVEEGVARRGEIRVGDFMTLELPRRTFDLVLLNNNLHYFPPAEHGTLLRRVRSRLNPTGVLAIQTPVVSDQRASRLFGAWSTVANFDLYLRMHRNLHGLPDLAALQETLRECGFGETGEVAILPGRSVVYVWARPAKEAEPSD